MKRKNNDAKDAAEYGAMVFRQDGAVLVPDSEGLVKAIINAIQEAQKKRDRAQAREEIVHEILDMLDELKPRFNQIDYVMGWNAAITAMRYMISKKYKQGENNDTEMHQE